MTVYVFPGQGSQKIGMGGDLFDQYPLLVEEANSILGYDIKRLCLDDPEKQLNQTQYTQPALYTVNALTYLSKQDETSMEPSYVAGHSLGEYNALFAAHVFDFATGLKLVQKRGLLMSQATKGGMAAILGLTQAQVLEVLSQPSCQSINIANYNSNRQFVISGPKSAIEQSIALFGQAGASMVIPLNVSGAFHSPLMMPAREQFYEFLKQFHFSSPAMPVIANISAAPYLGVDTVIDYLAAQITDSVQWTATIDYLLEQGETQFLEIGPGMVLTGLIRRIKNKQ